MEEYNCNKICTICNSGDDNGGCNCVYDDYDSNDNNNNEYENSFEDKPCFTTDTKQWKQQEPQEQREPQEQWKQREPQDMLLISIIKQLYNIVLSKN
jgi:hypothetical protein